MPITRSALKKQRQDVHRQHRNTVVKRTLHEAMKAFQKSPTPKKASELFSLLDRAKKKKILHENKVGRLKSRIAKAISGKKPETGEKKSPSPAAKKPVKKKTVSKKA
jgi:ribosomal protein S20